MDFSLVGFDNLLSSNNAAFSLDNNKHKSYGSGFLKQDRDAINEDDFRDFKVAKTASCNDPMLKIPLHRSNSSSLTEGHQQMLCFSSPNSLPYYSAAFSGRNAGYGSTGINSASMQGVRGPFTPSQWIELEHQALIYKYITANVPVPSSLLNPIRKAFESAGFSSFSGLRSNALGWGAFHLGFSNTDPEPGRCRRTDGKKWRCSRDAVADQKYCERHMNRGRHRSRKPVEGQSGHAASGTTTTSAKPPPASSSSSSAVPPGGVSNSLGLSHHHQLSNMQHGSSNHLPGIPNINRSLLDKENTDEAFQHTTLHSITSPKVCTKNHYSIPKQQNPYEESSRSEFGLVCSDSLLNPLNRSSSLITCRNYSSTSDNLNDHEPKSQNHPLRQFMDDWPKNNSERSTWPDTDLQPDRTQLSISIPMVTSDFMSSASSPTNEKLRASPQRLSNELEMGLGVGTISCQENQRQINYVPISWEPSPGGPLAEVLHTKGDGKNSTKPLNLIDSWDNSPRLASSPTGVLQRGAFGSLSNSSAGSSPRTDGIIGSSVMNHPSFPAL